MEINKIKSVLGEQHSPDLIGEPKESNRVHDGKREPKGSPDSHRTGGNADSRPEKPTVEPPLKPVVVTTNMDKQSLINSFSLMYQNPTIAPLTAYYFGEKVIAKDPKSVVFGAGIGALIDAAQWSKDINTFFSAQEAITKHRMNMKAGEINHILVSAAPEGDISIIKLISPDAPILSDGKSNSFITTISAPNFIPTVPPLTEQQKMKELHNFFESLSKEQRSIINQERKRLFLGPI